LRSEISNIELKESARCISSMMYKTVRTFLNTKGGDIFLEVKDNENIILIGLAKEHISSIKQDSLFL
jgi:predicted HTH transcriptional regulator